jgi:hypothetical protein
MGSMIDGIYDYQRKCLWLWAWKVSWRRWKVIQM